MRILIFIAATMLAIASPAPAQVARDAAATLGRDVAAQPGTADMRTAPLATTIAGDALTSATPAFAGGLFIGAINVEGGSEIPRDIFAPVIERFIGKQADAAELQVMARAIADAARAQGYIFASAMVPRQTVSSGTVTVKLDSGAVEHIRVQGSENEHLRKMLNLIIGPAVRKEVLERQLLLAGDIPQITVVSTQYVRESGGATLIVDVAKDRVAGSIGLDNHGSRDIGPARLRLHLDLTGLLDDSDKLTVQSVVTPLQPEELAYGSVRYLIEIGAAGTQMGIAAAVGKTKPDRNDIGNRQVGESLYGAIFVNHPVLRSNLSSLWVNAELAFLRIDQKSGNVLSQHDEIATLTLSTTATTLIGGGWLWGGFELVQGLGIRGTTRRGDPLSSRFDGSGVFTKASMWADWTRNLAKGLSVRLSVNGQLANRPLLSAQEIGVGGPGYGRGYDFSERFGDNGVLGLIEVRQQFDKPVKGVDWVQFYHFADGGYAENMVGGFGDGARWSAGAGLRTAFGKMNIGVEAAFPINAVRDGSNDKSPRINLTVGQSF